MKEDRLQYECFTAFSDKYHPELYGNLIGTFQNSFNGGSGSRKKSMGLVAGVADMLYFKPCDNKVRPIELKIAEQTHDVAHMIRQAKWIITVSGNDGYFCTSTEGFMYLIETKSPIYHQDVRTAKSVLSFLEKTKKKSIVFQEVLDNTK